MTFSVKNLETLFLFPIRDSTSKQILTKACLLGLLGILIPPIPYIIIFGYCSQIMSKIIKEGSDPYLPDWTDWKDLFRKGIKIFVVMFVYSLPVLITMIPLTIVLLSFSSISFLESANLIELEDIPAMLPLVGFLIMLATFGLQMMIGTPIRIIIPTAVCHTVFHDSISAGFRVKEWWQIFRENIAEYLLAYGIETLFNLLVVAITQFLILSMCFIFLYPLALGILVIYAALVFECLYAQIYRNGVQKLKAKIEISA